MTVTGVRGFYSRIDGSAQPYILTMPDRYDPAAKRAYRLDLFLHGRDYMAFGERGLLHG